MPVSMLPPVFVGVLEQPRESNITNWWYVVSQQKTEVSERNVSTRPFLPQKIVYAIGSSLSFLYFLIFHHIYVLSTGMKLWGPFVKDVFLLLCKYK